MSITHNDDQRTVGASHLDSTTPLTAQRGKNSHAGDHLMMTMTNIIKYVIIQLVNFTGLRSVFHLPCTDLL